MTVKSSDKSRLARRELLTTSAAETRAVGRQLGELLEGGEVLALVGDLGSGKTTLTKGLCEGLGVADVRVVCSPTYVLEHIYEARRRVHHFDAYRLDGPEQFVALGFRDQLEPGAVLVIEWADRVLGALPDSCLRVDLEALPGAPAAEGERRRLCFSGPAVPWAEKLEQLSLPGIEGSR